MRKRGYFCLTAAAALEQQMQETQRAYPSNMFLGGPSNEQQFTAGNNRMGTQETQRAYPPNPHLQPTSSQGHINYGRSLMRTPGKSIMDTDIISE